MNNINQSWSFTFKTTLFLAFPILLAHVIEGLFPFVNTILAARLGQNALAAAGLVGSVFIFVMGFSWGVTTSVGVIAARCLTIHEDKKTGEVLKACFLFCSVYSLPVVILFWNMEPILLALKQDPIVAKEAGNYFKGLAFGLPADFGKFAIFQYLAAYNRPRVAVVTHVFSLVLLVLINISLMNGYWIFPNWGMFGLGIGTSITYWFAFLCMLLYVLFKKPYCLSLRIKTSYFTLMDALKEILKLGVPIGFMFLIEIALFTTVALLMGKMGTATLAAHQIAIQMSNITVLFAFGFAEAVAILVGKSSAEKNLLQVRKITIVGTATAVTLMMFVALCHWFLPEAIIGIDLNIHDPINEEIITIALSFLMLSAFFQLFDSARIVTAGALRGMKDSQYSMWVTLISFWFLGLPVGYYFAFYNNWNGVGLWLGMIIAVASGLFLQFKRLANLMQPHAIFKN